MISNQFCAKSGGWTYRAGTHKYEKITSIGVTNLLRRFGMNGDAKAGRKKATDIVDCSLVRDSEHAGTMQCKLTYNNLLVDNMLSFWPVMYEIRRDTHHNDRT